MRGDEERLRDILEAVERIERYSSAGRERFEQDELVQTWVLRHLQVIGEAVRALSPRVRSTHPEVPWSDIVGMRHILVHRYFGIDAAAAWSVVEQHVPVLKQQVLAILHELGASWPEPDDEAGRGSGLA